jgi:transcriptional regulator with XRE-family HTH domain
METVFIVDIECGRELPSLPQPRPHLLISTDPAADLRLTAVYQEIGNRIARARKKSKLSQHDLAVRIGLQRTSVTNIEKGRQKVMVHTLVDMAKHLNVEANELLPRGEAEGSDVTSLFERGVRDTLKPQALRFIEKSASKGKVAAPKLRTIS